MTETIKEFLSPTARRWFYVAFALIGVGFGATQTAYVTAEVSAPTWLTVAFQVYLYVGGAFGLVAASNTTKTVDTELENPHANVNIETGESGVRGRYGA